MTEQLRVRYWDDFLCPWCWIGSVRREKAAREAGPRVAFERRSFLLLPGVDERPVHDDYVIAHRIAARDAEPSLGFAIPEKGSPYPRSSLPAQLVALRVRADHPERVRSLERRLYHAVFVRLEDVADPAILRRCCETAGVPPELVDRALADPELRAQAFREHEEALELGITGIPALAIPGQPPIVGAVPWEEIRDALLRALGEPARAVPESRVGRRLPKAG